MAAHRGPGGHADRWDEIDEEDGELKRTARWFDKDGDPVRVILWGDSVFIATGRARKWVQLNDAQADELA